jgi:hypothetical protein
MYNDGPGIILAAGGEANKGVIYELKGKSET